jgi:DedD protein
MNVNTNRMVELALVFFVSLLSFSIGTFVGKKYSDNQHRLAKLEPHSEKAEEIAKEMSEAANAAEPKIVEHKQETLTDAEVAQMAREFSEEEDSNIKDVEIPEREVAATSRVTTSKALKKLVAVRSKDVKEIENTEGFPKKNIVRDVASIAAKVRKANAQEPAWYTVQVAAYPNPEEAGKMVATLGARGYKGRAVEAEVNGRKWFRVHVGQFENFRDADTYKKEIMEQNRLTSALVQKIALQPTPAAPTAAATATAAPTAAHEGHSAPTPAPTAAAASAAPAAAPAKAPASTTTPVEHAPASAPAEEAHH